MCGIAGIINAKTKSDDVLEAMLNSIKHRGPDDSGTFVNESGSVLLGSRRLAIQDVSEKGHMPMKNDSGDIWVTQNGEIYNYPEVRKELESLGYKFVSNSDTEAIIHGYEEWGIKVIEKLRGMFAIALFDRGANKAFLVRDRLGIKPLYYLVKNETLYFSSEAKAFNQVEGFDLVSNLDFEKLSLLLGFMFLPENESTIIKGVKKLAPGHYMEIRLSDFTLKEISYWNLHATAKTSPKNFDQAVEELDNLLSETVSQHLISDVPLGVMLSGGLDSSLITALMKKATSSEVKTFTAKFDHKMNESEYAKSVASHLGTEHTEIFIDTKDINDNLESYVPDFDDMTTLDGGLITTKVLCGEIKKRGITVLLLGEGSDELFGGYSWFSLSKFPFSLMPYRIISGLYYYAISRNLTNRAGYYANEWYKKTGQATVKHYFDRISSAELTTQLPNHFLMKVDKGSMSKSIEARVPYLDHKVVEYVYSLPENYKLRGNSVNLKKSNEKHILRAVAAKYLPKEIVERKKRGFMLPMDDVIKANQSKVRDYVFAPSSLSARLLPKKYLESLFKTSSLKILETEKEYMKWRLFLLEVWAKSYGK